MSARAKPAMFSVILRPAGFGTIQYVSLSIWRRVLLRLTPELERFDALLDEIRAHAPNAQPVQPSWRDRLF